MESFFEMVTRLKLNVGDVLEFPGHAKSTCSLIGGGGYGVALSHGAPGKFVITALDEKDRTVVLKPYRTVREITAINDEHNQTVFLERFIPE